MPSWLKSASACSTVGVCTPLRNATSMTGMSFGSASRYHASALYPVKAELLRYDERTTWNLPAWGLPVVFTVLTVLLMTFVSFINDAAATVRALGTSRILGVMATG